MKYLKSKASYVSLENQFLRFFMVGGFCAFLNIVILYILTGILNFHYLLSVLIQTVVVNYIGFYLNRRFTFKRTKGEFWEGLAKYYAVMISSFLMVSSLMYLLVDIFHVWYLYAFVLITIMMMIFNFLSHQKWTFKK
ncbi:GtrA family protein [Pseudanabaena sp. UWO310]|uniref:GtrA family protein n=1 Tax=Pseudanabaena sp. UWO310 TaxID=2480795 RepID=UPI0011575647|nr:GtrA family protein [Pseudanabaena sp. UWO310]TYQ30716.1 GtrA family protein [Pseudanabaena sp. UWO310]